MAWFGKVSLGGLQDLAGAVNKISESVKNIEKNFDSALGLEEKRDGEEASGSWASLPDTKGLFDPVMALMGHKGDESSSEVPTEIASPEHPPAAEESNRSSAEGPSISKEETVISAEKDEEDLEQVKDIGPQTASVTPSETEELNEHKIDDRTADVPAQTDISIATTTEATDSVIHQEKEKEENETRDLSLAEDSKQMTVEHAEQTENSVLNTPDDEHHASDSQESHEKFEKEDDQVSGEVSPDHDDGVDNSQVSHGVESKEISVGSRYDDANKQSDNHEESISSEQDSTSLSEPLPPANASSELAEVSSQGKDSELEEKKSSVVIATNLLSSSDPVHEIEKLKKEMSVLEAALQGAARQAQAKADDIAKLMNENEQLKSVIEDLKRKSMDSEIDALKEEYHLRVSSLERKVYALTRERDTLRREQSKKSDAAALLKEKDEIINQVMAEGEELSKKQAAQEGTIRKLRAQIRELEEEKQRLNSRLQVEETKVESIKRDKAATEKLLQETIERNQTELAAQKEFYANALNAAKEAEALAEARANSEAKIELESRLREAGEKEAMLVQTLEELRHTLTRKEQEAAFREEMLKRDFDDLQKRYQASELRYNELITQVPESTRPLLRQIEAMQETAARRAEAWTGVERALNSRLQEAEAKAAAAEERERSLNERLSQSSSRITVLETQITCLRTEQTQLSRSLEKERQRASESRQEYLAIKEEAATQEGRAKQLEHEIKELRTQHKKELQEATGSKELLEKELERERSAREELEKVATREAPKVVNQDLTRNYPIRKLSSAGSLNSIEESFFLQASLDSSDGFLSERRMSGESNVSQYFLKSMTPNAFEAALRQKDGELQSYMSRLASLESIRNSLAEDLVKMTEKYEKLKVEAAVLPRLRDELDALRRRHSAALELMGERDEELEELRADIVDLKEMYREQVSLLVNKMQMLSSSV
ncbi:golgin candidate 5 [Ananas comosus]|uniref:Golgin candidate 5 n=1 Tax=Ananas comosus TaxID=4615 RepID=A0A6P5GC76_ANACO|nr:golgin candidate 5 [Ananas comosus]